MGSIDEISPLHLIMNWIRFLLQQMERRPEKRLWKFSDMPTRSCIQRNAVLHPISIDLTTCPALKKAHQHQPSLLCQYSTFLAQKRKRLKWIPKSRPLVGSHRPTSPPRPPTKTRTKIPWTLTWATTNVTRKAPAATVQEPPSTQSDLSIRRTIHPLILWANRGSHLVVGLRQGRPRVGQDQWLRPIHQIKWCSMTPPRITTNRKAITHWQWHDWTKCTYASLLTHRSHSKLSFAMIPTLLNLRDETPRKRIAWQESWEKVREAMHAPEEKITHIICLKCSWIYAQ